MREINLEPNWPNTTRWFAYMLAEHGFIPNYYQGVAQFAQMVLKLYHDDPTALLKLIEELNAKDKPVNLTILGREDEDGNSNN